MTSKRKDMDAAGRSYAERRQYVREARALLKEDPENIQARAMLHGNSCDICIDCAASWDYSECCEEGRALFVATDVASNTLMLALSHKEVAR